MKENPDDPRTVLCNDLLAPEGYGEIIGGSQREDDLDRLLARIREEDLPEEAYDWYLDLRRYGTFPHSGFGLGLERTVGWITGDGPHIRELVPLPASDQPAVAVSRRARPGGVPAPAHGEHAADAVSPSSPAPPPSAPLPPARRGH